MGAEATTTEGTRWRKEREVVWGWADGSACGGGGGGVGRGGSAGRAGAGRESRGAVGRAAEAARVVAVGKTKPVSMLRQLYDAGHRCFGENYVQEIVTKAPQVRIRSNCSSSLQVTAHPSACM